MSKKSYPVGMIECIECYGHGEVSSSYTGPIPCETCNGEGYVKCEHQEFDHGICMDCSYDQTPDLIDAVMDMGIDEIMEQKADANKEKPA